ncbi:MAG: insulinase family protein [Verrucomicrobia bacterium]|nr:insulinase family protein [Verrucomicrobiota bacterium]
MIIPLLFTVGLCALPHAATSDEMRLDALIPQEESVHVMHLANGVKTYVQENQVPPHCASFRVVMRNQSCEEVQYSYDGKIDAQESIDRFLMHCKEQASARFSDAVLSLEGCSYTCSDLPSLRMGCPQEIAVIAVGDFDSGEIELLIQRHFGDIVLGNDNFSSECSASIRIGCDEAISKVAMRISYPNLSKPIYTYEDLKESLKFLLLQELFQQRMERCSKGVDESWVHPHPRFFYPVNGYTFSSEESSENLLSFLLWQVEAIRNDGFFEDEFYATKRKMINQFQYLASSASRPDDAFLASYYVDQFLLGERCPSYQVFLEAAAQLVQDIQSKDLLPYLSSFLLDKNRQIQVVYPMPIHAEILTVDRIEQMIQRVASLASFYRNSEIPEDAEWILETGGRIPFTPLVEKSGDKADPSIQLVSDEGPSAFRLADSAIALSMSNPSLQPEPFASNDMASDFIQLANSEESPLLLIGDNKAADGQGNPVEPFYQLPLTEKEKRFIKIIISTMADKNIIQLALEKRTLEKKGKKVNHVHPLRFVGYILSNSSLKSDLKAIKKSSFKWDAFIDGFSKRMREELSNGNVYKHVPGFAQQVGGDPEDIKHYIGKKDFEGLVKSLL